MRKVSKVVVVLLCLLDGLVILLGIVMNHLSHTKAGVYRHIYTRMIQFQEGWGGKQWLFVHPKFIAILTLGIVVILFLHWKNRWWTWRIHAIMTALLGMGLFYLCQGAIQSKIYIYPYLLCYGLVAILLHMIALILEEYKFKKKGRII